MDTGFSELPITVQVGILDLCYPLGDYWNGLKNLRLVNKEWLKLVMYLKRLRFVINNKSLDIFSRVDNTNHLVGNMKFKDVTNPLPIWSSTRIKLPRTKCLTLSGGISSENIHKLLRYFIGNCTSLQLKGTCLKSVKHYQISSGIQVNNIKTLKIVDPFSTHHSLMLGRNFETNQHIRNLTEMFKKVAFPNMTAVTFISRSSYEIGYLYRFLRGLLCFLKKHAKQLESLKIVENHIYVWPCLVEFLQHYVHLEKLEVNTARQSFNNLLIPADFRKSMSPLKKLKHLKLGIYGKPLELELIQRLLQDNSNTLRTFHLNTTNDQCILSLNFLYSNPSLQITELKISFFQNLTQELEKASNFDFTLPMVQYLALDFMCYTYLQFGPVQGPWKENLVKWITQCFPNLKELKLQVLPYRPCVSSEKQFEARHISDLIQGLPYLVKMDLKLATWGFDHHERYDNLISTGADQWIFSNYPNSSAVHVNSLGCKIYDLRR